MKLKYTQAAIIGDEVHLDISSGIGLSNEHSEPNKPADLFLR